MGYQGIFRKANLCSPAGLGVLNRAGHPLSPDLLYRLTVHHNRLELVYKRVVVGTTWEWVPRQGVLVSKSKDRMLPVRSVSHSQYKAFVLLSGLANSSISHGISDSSGPTTVSGGA